MLRRVSSRLGLGAVALGAALFAMAPAAGATDITNPADHPYPITVTIDGQTYHDGQDTLPGYDDYACTAIPNVSYDFADNEIDYYDDDGNLITTAHWTEWVAHQLVPDVVRAAAPGVLRFGLDHHHEHDDHHHEHDDHDVECRGLDRRPLERG